MTPDHPKPWRIEKDCWEKWWLLDAAGDKIDRFEKQYLQEIVTAVNAHEVLAAACEQVLTTADMWTDERVLKSAKDALASVERGT